MSETRGPSGPSASGSGSGGNPSGRKPEGEVEEGPGGLFPSWKAAYLTLIAYTALAVVALYLLTLVMNAGGS